MNASRAWVSVCVVVGLLANMASAVNMETVPVGNAGNAVDPEAGWGGRSGFGAVGYTYRMGKFEVTEGQYTEFLNAVARTDTYGLYSEIMDYDAYPDVGMCNIKRTGSPGDYTYSVAADWSNRPVNWVSWGDAARFANWMHNGQPTGNLTGNPTQDAWLTEDGSYYLNGATSDSTLLAVTRKADATWVIPSEDEWYKAAYHKNDGVTGNYWLYPTGTNSVPDNGNPGGDTGNSASFYDGDYTLGRPYWLTPVGYFGNSESPYGTFDQGGNVWEWNETVPNYDAFYSSMRGLRGGSYGDHDVTVLGKSRWGGRYPTEKNGSFGFRVAYVPEPATIVMLALASVGIIRRRKA